jgi:ribosomal protein S27AE
MDIGDDDMPTMKWRFCPNCGNERMKKKGDIYDCIACDSQWTKQFLIERSRGLLK